MSLPDDPSMRLSGRDDIPFAFRPGVPTVVTEPGGERRHFVVTSVKIDRNLSATPAEERRAPRLILTLMPVTYRHYFEAVADDAVAEAPSDG